MTDRRARTETAPPLPQQARDAIGRQLRENLERIVAEPVPDRFLKLLDELERNSGPQLSATGPSAPKAEAPLRDMD